MPRSATRVPTLRDVCRLAGVSIGTASRVLNPVATRDNTSPETQARVKEAAERLGYRVNAAARGIRGGRQGAILWMQSAGLRPTGRWTAMEAFAAALEGKDAHLIFSGLPVGPLAVDRLPKVFTQRVADAAVLCLGRDMAPEAESRLREQRTPWVLVNGRLDVPSIIAGDEAASAAVVAGLVAQGHRRIVYFDMGFTEATVDGRMHCSRIDRLAGYRRGMIEAGLTPREYLDGPNPWGGEAEAAAIRAVLAMRPRTTAIVVQSVPTLAPVIAAGLSLQIPRDLSIASPGLDTNDLGGDISGHAVDWTGIGRAAAEAVDVLVSGRRLSASRVVPHLHNPGTTTAPVLDR